MRDVLQDHQPEPIQKKVKENEILCQAKRSMPGKKIDLSKDSGQKAILQLFMQRQGLLKRRHRCIKRSNCFFKRRSRVV